MKASLLRSLPLLALFAGSLGACSSAEPGDELTEDELLGGYSEDEFTRDAASAEDAFKYGSIGSDTEGGIPLTVFRVMPRAFPELLPRDRERDGWSAFGFIEEPGEEVPIGFSVRRYQLINRVGPNCAACHVGTYRSSEGDARRVVLGGAGVRVDVQGFLRFVARVAAHPSFSERLLAAMDERAKEKGERTWALKRPLVKTVLLPLTRKGLAKGVDVSWQASRPDWGVGRIDPFNPVKFGILKQPIDDTVGNSDMLPIWAMTERPSGAFHWDGLSTSLRDVFISSALGDGATLESVEVEHLDRMQRWLATVMPPPFPAAVDPAKVAAGKPLFDRECAQCHGDGGVYTWRVINQSHVGTDRHRLDMWTARAALAYNTLSEGQPWEMRNFQKTQGYLAQRLRGLWLTAPYLHNGSVPTLRALLDPPEARPRSFVRGYDVVDTVAGGFVSDARAEGKGQRVDVTVKGNSNEGHRFGTDTLTPDEKDALVEYLKTL